MMPVTGYLSAFCGFESAKCSSNKRNRDWWSSLELLLRLSSLYFINMINLSMSDKLPDRSSSLNSLSFINMINLSMSDKLPYRSSSLNSLSFINMINLSMSDKLPDRSSSLNSFVFHQHDQFVNGRQAAIRIFFFLIHQNSYVRRVVGCLDSGFPEFNNDLTYFINPFCGTSAQSSGMCVIFTSSPSNSLHT